MTFAKTIESLSDAGLHVVRAPEDRLQVKGDLQRLTPDLQAALKVHREEFLRLLPSDADRCSRIVSDTIDEANRRCPPAWFGSATAWETMDDLQGRLYDAARAADAKWCQQAADEYLQVCDVLFIVPQMLAWQDEPGPPVQIEWPIIEQQPEAVAT